MLMSNPSGRAFAGGGTKRKRAEDFPPFNAVACRWSLLCVVVLQLDAVGIRRQCWIVPILLSSHTSIQFADGNAQETSETKDR